MRALKKSPKLKAAAKPHINSVGRRGDFQNRAVCPTVIINYSLSIINSLKLRIEQIPKLIYKILGIGVYHRGFVYVRKPCELL